MRELNKEFVDRLSRHIMLIKPNQIDGFIKAHKMIHELVFSDLQAQNEKNNKMLIQILNKQIPRLLEQVGSNEDGNEILQKASLDFHKYLTEVVTKDHGLIQDVFLNDVKEELLLFSIDPNKTPESLISSFKSIPQNRGVVVIEVNNKHKKAVENIWKKAYENLTKGVETKTPDIKDSQSSGFSIFSVKPEVDSKDNVELPKGQSGPPT